MVALIEIGYRRFHGRRVPRFLAWAVIARAAIVQNWKSRVLRFITLLAWAPLLYFSLYFFAIGQATEPDNTSTSAELVRAILFFLDPGLTASLAKDPGAMRASLWTFAYHYMINITLLLATLLVPTTVGPGLIADDRKHGALTLYFSRPIGVFDYVLGKLAAICFFLAMVSLFPMVTLHAVSILTSPSMDALAQTSGVLLRVVVLSAVFILPTALLVLFLSSMTPRSGVLAFWWIGFIAGSQVASSIVREAIDARGFQLQAGQIDHSMLLSYWSNLDNLAVGILEVEKHANTLATKSRGFAQTAQALSHQASVSSSLAIIAALSGVALIGTLIIVRRAERGAA